MGFYRTRIVPQLLGKACGSESLQPWRSEAVAGLAGRVVEIGFGSGHNVALYPDQVARVLAVEPSSGARQLAAARIDAARVPVEHIGLDGASIPLDNNACDAALSTFVLCSVADPAAVLAELYRVLRPGGHFHFLEHGRAPEQSVVRWQERLEPLNRRMFDGCHLTRDVPSLITSAGFALERSEQRYAKGPKPWSYFSVGIGTKPIGEDTVGSNTGTPTA